MLSVFVLSLLTTSHCPQRKSPFCRDARRANVYQLSLIANHRILPRHSRHHSAPPARPFKCQASFLKSVLRDLNLRRSPSLPVVIGAQLASDALSLSESVDVIRISRVQSDGHVFPRYRRKKQFSQPSFPSTSTTYKLPRVRFGSVER